MSSKHKKLGSLADIYQSQNLDGAISKIKLDLLRPSENQPRQERQVGVDDLAASIKTDGLLSPIIVTKEGEGYRIIAGERRFHAVSKLGWKEVECRVISRKERDLYRISIIENLQRENLTPFEEANALHQLKSSENLSDADLAGMVGKSRNYITEILGIATLPETARNQCQVAGIDNKNLMIQAVQAFKKDRLDSFLDAFRSGEIKTIRDARAFIQSPTEGEKETNIPEKSTPARKTEQEKKNLVPGGFSIQTNGKTLSIECPSSGEASKLKEWIESIYLQNK